jgi:myo-inositol-1(or 4)-monophosphatase
VSASVVDLLGIADEVARAAGDLLRRRPADLHAASKTTPTDAVTDMDRAAERLIVNALHARRPGDPIIGEESGRHAGDLRHDSETVTWLVDPIDGTVNYLYGIPQFAVSIAAQVADTTVAGVVYDVTRDEMYAATTGGGSTRDGVTIHCTAQADPALSLLATGFGYAADMRARQADILTRILPAVRDIRRMGAASLDLCAVACGWVDGYYEAGMHPWDWAAGALIATEAGARVGGLGGRPPGEWTTLAANPTLFAWLERVLVEAGADAPPS